MTAEKHPEKLRIKLETRVQNARNYVEHLAEPGWVEEHLAKRGPEFAGRLPDLKLEGVDPITYFERLTGRIKRVQERLLNKTLPYLTRKIEDSQSDSKEFAYMESEDYLGWLDFEDNFKRRDPKPLKKPYKFRRQSYTQVNANLEEADKNPVDKESMLPDYMVDPKAEPLRDYSKLITHPQMQVFLDRINNPVSRTLFERFLQSEDSVTILNSIVKFYEQLEELRDNDFFEKALAGAMFAQLGYLYLAPLYEKQNRTLLSPNETFTLFRNAKRKAEVLDDTGFGLNRSLMGQTLPNGVIITTSNNGSGIKLIVDYRLGGISETNPRVVRQLKAYSYLLMSKNLELDREVSLEYLADLINLMRLGTVNKPLTVDPKVELSFILPNTKKSGLENIPIETYDLYLFRLALAKILKEQPANVEVI